jgi:spore maturation protein SpmA
MNVIFFALIAIAFVVTGFHQLTWVAPSADAVSPDSAKGAVTLALGLVGVMAFFLGLMKVAEAGGLLLIIARLLRPLLVRLFPDVPADHPAMGAMIMNLSANALGLGNAATPFGIRAMQALDSLNPHKGTASNSMALFLAINTSSIAPPRGRPTPPASCRPRCSRRSARPRWRSSRASSTSATGRAPHRSPRPPWRATRRPSRTRPR